MDAAFTAWVPKRRAQVHTTHPEVIGHRAARDHAALKTLPPAPYLVAERHLRPVGKDCLVAFAGNLYSVPARKVRPRQLVEIRATKSQVTLHSTAPDDRGETLLAMHERAVGRGVRVVEEAHWDGLPTGKSRRTTTGEVPVQPRHNRPSGEEAGPLQALLNRAEAACVEVGRRPLSVYDELAGTRPFTTGHVAAVRTPNTHASSNDRQQHQSQNHPRTPTTWIRCPQVAVRKAMFVSFPAEVGAAHTDPAADRAGKPSPPGTGGQGRPANRWRPSRLGPPRSVPARCPALGRPWGRARV
ncbi:Mu transposase domain-containing protein [Streptomyces sp. NBC_01723]|uniref:Mu transposase domain-containing protein n=1 Tax=Streptomyces sp. NBC_01723 TaxID=2975921 RepID=UPI003FCD67F1